MFASLNIVGSNNNYLRNREEYTARNAANLAWLSETFAAAKAQEVAGVMILIHANPRFEEMPNTPIRAGFDDFIAALNAEGKFI